MNWTYVLNRRELAYLKKHNRIQGPRFAPGFLRILWYESAKIRGILDLAAEVRDRPSGARGLPSREPYNARFAGKKVYFAIMEQSIVAIVSAWEMFVRVTIQHILNQRALVVRLAQREDQPLKLLAREFRLTNEILLELNLKGLDSGTVRLGDVVVKSRRISWQSLDNCKRVVNLLFPDVRLNSFATDWSEVMKLFRARNKVVHEAGEDIRMVDDYDIDEKGRVTGPFRMEEPFRLAKEYEPERVETILVDILLVAEGLFNRLFSTYEPDQEAERD